MILTVDKYLLDGCMRCKLGATPACKVHNWRLELETLRHIVLESGLKEEIKWSVPCYTSVDKNIVMISAFKEYTCLSFFKGVLLEDAQKVLIKQGENSEITRILKYTDAEQIIQQAEIIKAYISEAIELEKAGTKIEAKPISDFVIPTELEEKFEELPLFRKAFYALTQGKQRGYLLHFSQPKQSKTKTTRIENCIQKILDGKGFHD